MSMDLAGILRGRRAEVGLSQGQLADAAGVGVRQVRRYEAGEAQPVLGVAVALARALDISVDQLAGQHTGTPYLTGSWSALWTVSPRDPALLPTHPATVVQHGHDLAANVEDGGTWRVELRLWDGDALMGSWHRPEPAAQSRGALYLVLHPEHLLVYGRWVGLGQGRELTTGWVAAARSSLEARAKIQELLRGEPPF